MKYALKLPTNWQAVKMETDLEEKIEAKPCRITQHTHTQSVYVCVQFSWKFEHCRERGSGGGWSSLPIAVSVFII